MARRGRAATPTDAPPTAAEAGEDAARPSRAEKKRARRQAGEAGHETAEAVVRLTRGSVLRLRLPEPVEAAALEFQRLGRNPAAARQLRFLARLVREHGQADIEHRLRLLHDGLPLPPRGVSVVAEGGGDATPAPDEHAVAEEPDGQDDPDEGLPGEGPGRG